MDDVLPVDTANSPTSTREDALLQTKAVKGGEAFLLPKTEENSNHNRHLKDVSKKEMACPSPLPKETNSGGRRLKGVRKGNMTFPSPQPHQQPKKTETTGI